MHFKSVGYALGALGKQGIGGNSYSGWPLASRPVESCPGGSNLIYKAQLIAAAHNPGITTGRGV